MGKNYVAIHIRNYLNEKSPLRSLIVPWNQKTLSSTIDYYYLDPDLNICKSSQNNKSLPFWERQCHVLTDHINLIAKKKLPNIFADLARKGLKETEYFLQQEQKIYDKIKHCKGQLFLLMKNDVTVLRADSPKTLTSGSFGLNIWEEISVIKVPLKNTIITDKRLKIS